MSTATKPLTVQKLHSIIRKAGFERARWIASSRVRGWGSWTTGYDVRTDDYKKRWEVGYITRDAWSKEAEERNEEYRQSKIAQLADALSAVGISFDRDEHTGRILVPFPERVG